MTVPVSLLRPGVVSGRYPQRRDLREAWLDTISARAGGVLRQRLPWRAAPPDSFVAAVAALGPQLQDATQASIEDRIRQLKRLLYSKGFTSIAVIESFAIVRELSRRTLGIRHHDEQVAGGWAMLNGRVAEMETGEGKTITALLPACTAALSGIPVHVITVNDFLVQRDANELRPVYESLGLTIGSVIEGMDLADRRRAYRADVTYCTNKQLAFDYLKDTLLLEEESRPLHLELEGLYRETPRIERMLMRGLCFAIVDEADSVLVDEARTPLVISGKGEPGAEATLYFQALSVARELEGDLDFTVRHKDKQIELTQKGLDNARDLSRDFGGVWSGEKRRRELITQALVAMYLYEADVHYLVKDDAIQIIDEYTGRVMADRSWERGLHQMIEAKEGCPISGRQETLARISYQRFFKRYLRLAGMTGTAREITAELWSVYNLGVTHVPTHRPLQREQLASLCYLTESDKWSEVIRAVQSMHAIGRPVLLGTRTVADSEQLSERLSLVGLDHVVLNARQDAEEARVIASAGDRGKITVATNMAGRGTDIRLDDDVVKIGGLHVLATCLHEARRIDRQLSGRCARQGDPGSFQMIVSLEDEIFTHFLNSRLLQLAGRLFPLGKPLPAALAGMLCGMAQRRAESHHRRIRRELMKLDDNLMDMLSFSGKAE